MHLLHLSARSGFAKRRVSRLALLFATGNFAAAVLCLPGAAPGQIQDFSGRKLPGGQDVVSGVYLPTDRSLSRAITRARERLNEHEYHEALAFLHGILARDEDSFLERTGDERGQLGLKATARQMIGDLPPQGHDAYELLNGATARRELEAALRKGDRNAVARVVRQYFHTSAGYEAALVLAQIEADQGHRLAAAQLYQELIATPRAAARFEPQLSLAAALNQMAAGRPDDAAQIVRSLVERKAYSEIRLSGKTASLPALGADPVAWLTSFVGEPSTTAPAEGNWLTLHGDPSRNAQAPGGRPHLRPRWEARVVNEPSIESYLNGRSDDFLQRGVVAIPGARPIAVGDVVVMRTPENVVAVDWQTGKRIWETRDEEELDSEDTSPELAPGIDHEQWVAQGKPLEERMWDDALVTSLSSDGERVFVVRGVTVARDDDVMGWQMGPGFGRMGGGEVSAATNQLAAYDLATQGKLTWELDGGRSTGALAGAFFLGAPVAIDNTLFVMAEIRSALYLLALDPATGHVQWQQQLIGLEQGIALDPARRRVGATPSYAGGILVCPTAASAVVAIDVVKREFAWVYRYPREAQSAAEIRNLWQQQQIQGQLVRANDQWLDSSAVIADGRVLVTPPESAEIHCLDVNTGKLLWKRRQGDALFIGGVDHGNVLLIGSHSIQALRLSDGAPAWPQESVPLVAGALPSGQGFLSEGRYYLPLTTGQIAEIEMESGKFAVVEPAPPDVALGNLICYRGSVLSQSPLVLDKFEQLDLLRQRTESALARNPDDAAAVRELAELKRADGQKPEAVRLLKRAYELASDDPVTQEILVELLLEELSADYATYRTDVPLVTRLIRNRDQQIELLRIDAGGLDAPGQRLASWDAYLRLADYTAEEPAYLRIDDNYTVRSDRWISGRLEKMWSSASPDERKAIAAKAAARRPALEKPRTATELRHYLSHLGALPGTYDVRQALARYLVERDRSQEAEIELLAMLASPDHDTQSAAAELMAKLDAKSDERDAASSVKWPRGHVDAELISASPAQNRERNNRVPVERQTGFRQLRIEQDFRPKSSAIHWFIAMDCSEIVGRNTLGDDVFHLSVDQDSLARQYRDSGLVHAARLGHLLFVALGGQIMAIDSRRDQPGAESDLLWPTHPTTGHGPESARPRRGFSAAQNRTSRPPVYHAWSGRKRIAGAAGNAIGSLGPVSPRGVVFQDQDELKCVDPLSGATLWARTDVPAGCELFGDDEFVFAADVGADIAYVVRLIDGELVGKREFPKSEWLVTAGRNIAQLGFGMSHGSRVIVISVTDVWSQEVLYKTEYPIAARVSVVEPNALAVFDPAGQFHLIDVQTGRLLIDQKLDAVNDLQAIYTLRAGDELFLFVTSQVQPQYKPIGQPFDYPLVNGPVYAFSLKTGEPLWPGSAVVRNRGVVLSQPQDVPFLVFAERQMIRDATTGGGSQLRVLCLDKRTGQSVYRNDMLPDTSVTRFRIRGETDTRPMVALEMSAGTIQLTMTDRPRPPQPPANDDLEVARESVERGLRGLGRRMSGALRGALEKASSNAPTPAEAKPANPPTEQKTDEPAKKNTDDD